MCCFPMKAFYTGYKTDKGKRDLVIRPHGFGDFLNVKHVKGNVSPSAPLVRMDGQTFIKDPIPIPCGKCVECRMNYARQLKNRAVLESLYAISTWFVTLTYDDEHLPFGPSGNCILVKKDLQKFFKRLRRRSWHFRYLACGEYGSTTHRAHYHFLLFYRGGRPLDMKLIGVNNFESCILKSAWTLGNIMIQEATPGSIAYVAGYVEKKQTDPHYYEYEQKPFRLSSNRPGLGYEYYRDHCMMLLDDPHIYGDFGGSNHQDLPQYFIRLLESDDLDIKDFKDKKKLQGERFTVLEDAIYGMSNKERIGFTKKEQLDMKLDKKRRSNYD